MPNGLPRGRQGASGSHIAEFAVAGADIAAYHERGGAVTPALRPVRAHAAAADCVQMFLIEKTHHLTRAEASRQFYFKPFRFASVIDPDILFLHIMMFKALL